MRTLVTGGAGFIGSHVTDALIEAGHDVRVLDNLTTGNEKNVHHGAELYVGDVADPEIVEKAMIDREVVFHLAACKAVPRSIAEPLETDRTNAHGTLTVLSAAHVVGVPRVISTSSSSVYGGAIQRPTPETAPTLPKSPYAVSKLAAEHYCRIYAELHGLETMSLRYFNVYGPRQPPNSAYAGVIPTFIRNLDNRESPTVHGDGLQSRDFTYVSDVVAANIAAAVAPAEVCDGRAINIARGDEHTLLDLLAILSDIMGVRVTPEHVGSRAGDVRSSCADNTLAREALGHTCLVNFTDGLRETVKWFSVQEMV